jgi:predicted protein tyrosine phosphatase
MEAKNILFVCSANVKRSPTAELWFSWLKPENNYTSAGSNAYACKKYGGKLVTASNLTAAHRVICMEPRNQKEIQKAHGHKFNDKIEVAGIKDQFDFLNIQLLFELTDKIKI